MSPGRAQWPLALVCAVCAGLTTPAAGAGGGGFSSVSPRPPFQRSLPAAGSTRTIPDVSAVASQFPGWPIVLAGNWVPDAGTSGSAPLMASAMAILAADQRRAHHPPVGPADGLFYRLASVARATFWDVVSGANGFLRRVPAHRARRGFDLASGLGVPRFPRLAELLPAPAR